MRFFQYKNKEMPTAKEFLIFNKERCFIFLFYQNSTIKRKLCNIQFKFTIKQINKLGHFYSMDQSRDGPRILILWVCLPYEHKPKYNPVVDQGGGLYPLLDQSNLMRHKIFFVPNKNLVDFIYINLCLTQLFYLSIFSKDD